MKKIAAVLSITLIAGVGFAQDGPYYGDFDKRLVIREGFGVNDKGEIVLDRNTEYVMDRLGDGTYSKTVDLTQKFLVKNKGNNEFEQSDYFYVVQFEEAINGAADCGPRIDPGKLRSFTLEKDTTVTFYARLWQNSDGAFRTQFICDAQRPTIYLSNLYSDEWDGKGIYTLLNRPGKDKIGRYVTPVTSRAEGKVELQFRILGMNSFEQQADVLDAYNVQKFGLVNTKSVIGRWQIMYDYPHFRFTYDKVLDYIRNPRLTINGEYVSDLSAIAIENANEGIVLGGDVSTTVLYDKESVDFSKVTAKLFYQIDELEAQSLMLYRSQEGAKDGEDDIWSATGQNILQGLVLSDGEHRLKMWFEAEYLGDVLTEDNKGVGYSTTFTVKSLAELENVGTSSDLVLTGDWNPIVFKEIIKDNLDNITTIDFTGVGDFKELPVLDGLNPNCLIYVNQDVTVAAGVNNIVVFDGESGSARNIILTDGYDFNNVRLFTADKATYSRDFAENRWSTICLPFTADIGDMIVEKFSKTEEDRVFFEKVSSIESNNPYLIKAKTPGFGKFESINVAVPPTDVLSLVTPLEEYVWHANYRKIEGGKVAGFYLLNNEGTAFEEVPEGNPADRLITAFSTYITTSAGKVLPIVHDDGSGTGSKSKETVKDTDNLVILSGQGFIEILSDKSQVVSLYTSDGRLMKAIELSVGRNVVSGLAEGLYIINHLKVVLK